MNSHSGAMIAAIVGLFLLSFTEAGVRLARISDFEDRAVDACRSRCKDSCVSVHQAMKSWFADLADRDAKRCSTCTLMYYAHDYDIDIKDCPCRVLEKFRKVATNKTLSDRGSCADCCLDFVMDAIPDAEECPNPEELLNERDSSETSFKNACGFTVKPPKREKDEEEAEAPSPAEKEEEEEKEKEEEKEEEEEPSDSAEESESDTKKNPYDYENLESQFDTCKCICKGLPPCKGAPVAADTTSLGGLGGFFDTAAFGAPSDETGLGAAGSSDTLAAILP